MRILVVSAGAVGGYFGGRLVEAGRDVTFLVRPRRAEQMARHGLRIDSLHGNAELQPRTVLADDPGGPHDLILLAVKAYSLDAAIDDFAPAVGSRDGHPSRPKRHSSPRCARCPLRARTRSRRIGPDRGDTRPRGAGDPAHDAGPQSYLRRTPWRPLRARPGHRLQLRRGEFPLPGQRGIVQEMWEKWVMLASLAGVTCLMRGSVGDILASPGGRDAMLALFAECQEAARAAGHEPRPAFVAFTMTMLMKAGSPQTASMLRDVEHGGPTEGEHVLGDLVPRAEQTGIPTPILRLARCHLATYAARRAREQATQ